MRQRLGPATGERGRGSGRPAERPRVTLVTGGARCGKSRYALEQVAGRPAPTFVATADALDDEMVERIRRHREERGTAFTTLEAPLDPAAALAALPADCGAAVVDCVTVWLGNLVHHWTREHGEDRPPTDVAAWPAVGAFLELLEAPRRDLVLVTNEVGWGIVPATPLGRAFRDLAGRVNQELAARAHRVVLVVSGVPLTVKDTAKEEATDG